MDGKVVNEEWDRLTDSPDLKTFFQWEPGQVYLGSIARLNQDVVWSLDMNGDGWLVGSDNLEVRLSYQNGGVQATLRKLDATNRSEPKWLEVPYDEHSLLATGVTGAGGWTSEVRFAPVGFGAMRAGMKVGIRAESIDPAAGAGEPYAPRQTALVFLGWDRSSGLPSGMTWEPEFLTRQVTPDDLFKFRFNFSNPGETALNRIACRSAGLAEASTISFQMPFPDWDNKGRSLVDYETRIHRDATLGYRILECRGVGSKNEAFIIQTSYGIVDTVTPDVELPLNLTKSPDAQIVTGKVLIRSNSLKSVRGKVTVTVPEDWSVNKGKTADFRIYSSRGLSTIPLVLVAPQGASGLIPIEVAIDIGSKKISKRFSLSIKG